MSATTDSRKVYLVCGATGKQGAACINALLDDPTPKTLRFLTRNPTSKASIKLSEKSCNAYEGDLLQPESLDNALRGVDFAFLVTEFSKGVDKEVEQGKNFVDAAKKAGVKHLVYSSVCDADKATSVPHFNSKYQVEQYIEASGLQYTITRPVAFMDNFPVAPGAMRFIAIGAFYALSAWKPVQFVAVEDIGVIAAKALLSPDSETFKNKKIDITAGEYGLDETLNAYEKAQGARPWIASLLPTWIIYALPYDFKQMMLYFRRSGYPKVDMERLRKIHPGLLSFQDWVAKNSGKKLE